MTDCAPDPFASLPHAELLRARVSALPLCEMGGVLVRAAEHVMTMPPGDPRRQYAQEYLARMLTGLECAEEIDVLERAVDPRKPERTIMLGELYLGASATMRHDYGGTDPLSMVDVEQGRHDLETAQQATAGMAVADAVLTREMFGPTDAPNR